MRLKPAALWILSLGSYNVLPAQVAPAPELTSRRQFGEARDERWPSLVQMPEGGYVLLANSEAYGPGDSQDVALLKVSSEGEREWETRWGGPQNELGASLDRTEDDGFIVGGSGNAIACEFAVEVVDSMPPVISCPGDIDLDTDCITQDEKVPAEFTATATDACDPHPSVACDPPSGSLFPLGTSKVMCIAKDA